MKSIKEQSEFYPLDYLGIDEAAKLLARSFMTYPLHQYIFENDWSKIDNIFPWYFKCLLQSFLQHTKIICLGKPIKGICIYSLPESPAITLFNFFKSGFYQLPFKVSPKSIKRLIIVNNALKEFKTLNKDEKHVLHIEILAIDPECQSQGLGRKLFQYVTNQFEHIHLVTHKIENIHFYEKMGCKLVSTEPFPKSSVVTFCMVYNNVH